MRASPPPPINHYGGGGSPLSWTWIHVRGGGSRRQVAAAAAAWVWSWNCRSLLTPVTCPLCLPPPPHITYPLPIPGHHHLSSAMALAPVQPKAQDTWLLQPHPDDAAVVGAAPAPVPTLGPDWSVHCHNSCCMARLHILHALGWSSTGAKGSAVERRGGNIGIWWGGVGWGASGDKGTVVGAGTRTCWHVEGRREAAVGIGGKGRSKPLDSLDTCPLAVMWGVNLRWSSKS